MRGTSFSLPKDFDPEKHFENAFFMQTGEPRKVELIFSKTTEPFINIRRFHHSQKRTRMRDGRIRLTMNVPAGEWDFEIVNFILSFHDNVEVVSPPELREAVKKKLQNALKQYRYPRIFSQDLRMSSRYMPASRDIDGLAFDCVFHADPDGIHRNEINSNAEQVLQVKLEIHEFVETRWVIELHQNIHVAVF